MNRSQETIGTGRHSQEEVLRAIMQADRPAVMPEVETRAAYDTAELLQQEWLKKEEAAFLSRVARATWDRYRAAKAAGDPAFKDFPNDYRNRPNGHLRFKTSEVVRWLNGHP